MTTEKIQKILRVTRVALAAAEGIYILGDTLVKVIRRKRGKK